jgi:hypothetical protein
MVQIWLSWMNVCRLTSSALGQKERLRNSHVFPDIQDLAWYGQPGLGVGMRSLCAHNWTVVIAY